MNSLVNFVGPTGLQEEDEEDFICFMMKQSVDTRDFCVAVIVDAIHTLDGCNRLIIALSSAGCDNERARFASAIVTITQRRLKDSGVSELSQSSNKRQKIGVAFSP